MSRSTESHYAESHLAERNIWQKEDRHNMYFGRNSMCVFMWLTRKVYEYYKYKIKRRMKVVLGTPKSITTFG